MTYPKTLRSDQLEQIAPIVEPMLGMAEGSAIVARCAPEQRSTLDYLLRSWLSINGLSRRFRISTVGEGLVIERKVFVRPSVEVLVSGAPGAGLGAEEKVVVEHLLGATTVREVERLLATPGFEDLDAEEVRRIWREKVMGGEGEEE